MTGFPGWGRSGIGHAETDPGALAAATAGAGRVPAREAVEGRLGDRRFEARPTGKTVDGPAGPVKGAMVGKELHDDGTYSDKVFAPGYGEFFSGHGSEVEALALAGAAYRREQVPPRLAAEMNRALKDLSSGIAKRDRTRAGIAAIDLAQSALDLELRYRDPAEIDLGRFELWASQVLVDAAAGDVGGVRSDVTTLEWIRDLAVSRRRGSRVGC